jgi:hypothetical protein
MAHTRFKSISYFATPRDSLIHPNALTLIEQVKQSPIVPIKTSFWDSFDNNPAIKHKYAERVYKTVMDMQTGKPKDQYAQIFKTLLITPD